ncbi:MAG: ECF-type sigma factor, partial [Planctomycetota bacterium]
MVTSADATRILVDIAQGDRSAWERLAPVIHDELRELAGGFMAQERPEHILQPTALVNEAFVRLIDQTKI